MSLESVLEKFDKLIPKKEFLTVAELRKTGLFGSSSATLKAVKKGLIPRIKVSCRRSLIPRESILKFIQDNFQEISK
jgi:hypothetical protein